MNVAIQVRFVQPRLPPAAEVSDRQRGPTAHAGLQQSSAYRPAQPCAHLPYSNLHGMLASILPQRVLVRESIERQCPNFWLAPLAGHRATLRWILYHKKKFLVVPVFILFAGMSVWLGIHRTLYPVKWAVNVFATERASPELKQLMYVDPSAE